MSVSYFSSMIIIHAMTSASMMHLASWKQNLGGWVLLWRWGSSIVAWDTIDCPWIWCKTNCLVYQGFLSEFGSIETLPTQYTKLFQGFC
jgi:hypothetical protein